MLYFYGIWYYVEHHYADCHYTECRYTECHGAMISNTHLRASPLILFCFNLRPPWQVALMFCIMFTQTFVQMNSKKF